MIESCKLNESAKDSNISYSEAQFNANFALAHSENWLSCKTHFLLQISALSTSF